MPGGQYNNLLYRYGFNGKEKDDAIKGSPGSSLDFGARIYDSRIGRWLSLDPFAEKYPACTPFAFAANAPILFIDPNGKEVFLHGKDAKATAAALDKVTTLKITLGKDGNLIASGTAQNDFDKALLTAINDKTVKVNLYTTNATHYISKDDGKEHPILVGAYEGSVDNRQTTTIPSQKRGLDAIDPPEEVTTGDIQTKQFFNLSQAQKLEQNGLGTVGEHAGHEILESYFGGVDDPGRGYPTGFKSAHSKALLVDPSALSIGIAVQKYSDGTEDIILYDSQKGNPSQGVIIIDGSKPKIYP